MTIRMPAMAAFILGLLLVIGGISHASDDEIHRKQSQLETLKKEIDKDEQRIREKEKKEHATLDLLDAYDHQVGLIRKLTAKLRDQETLLQQNINRTKATISDLGGQLSFLREQYARYVTTVYKYGRSYDLELLASSRSLNQLLVRAEYLKRFSDQRRKDLQNIDTRKQNLESQTLLLQQQLGEQRQLIDEKRKEESQLTLKMQKRKILLAEIRRDTKTMKREIDRKKQSEHDLEQMIAKLIEEDRAARERAAVKENRPPTREAAGTGFEAKRGRLRWPVSQGTLAARFGSHEHPVLHTVTQNNGIDISVPPGTDVDAVAEGEVSKIYWLPSFGNLVILNHQNGFRTVYAHLADIAVNEGDRVSEGTRLGSSGEAVSGPMLHFELYKDREKQNPELWLTPKGPSQR